MPCSNEWLKIFVSASLMKGHDSLTHREGTPMS